MSLDIGTLLHRRYRIVENLAQGGMGSVYSATDETLGIVVAVKENLFTTEEAARQFRLEATILANMRHPNLPRVTDHFSVEGQGQYLVMDFIEGEDLRERMERVGAIPEDDVIMIGAAICDALTYLHSRMPPILHRDIKPGNVKIAPNGHIVLLDFGLAKVLQGDQATTVGARAMTPGYSPPEQYGTARTDPRSDIYSLGATLYAAASGVIPEDGLARAMENAELEPLRKRNPGTSRRFALVIEKAMAVDPLDRFQTAEDFKRALLASKSKTQQPVGSYMIAPPPSSASDGHELVLAQAVKGNGNLITNSQKDVPFLTPRKRQSLRASRIRRLMIVGLLAVLFFGFVGVTLLAPDRLPQSFQRFLGASLITRVVSTPVFTITPLGAEMTPSDAEVVILPTQTEAVPQSTPSNGVVPTPPGSEDLQVAFASARSGLPQIYVTTLHGDITQ
ncbi:MAG TPA: serine/threonine-protein kinase, partial [Anaerolineales bacterium]